MTDAASLSADLPVNPASAPTAAASTEDRPLVVVVTGASGQVGQAVARGFAAMGAHLVLAARRGDALAPVALACRAEGGKALGIPTDVTDARAVERLVSRVISHLGRIDVWVDAANVVSVPVVDGDWQTPDGQLTLHAALAQFRVQGEGRFIRWVPAPQAAARRVGPQSLRGSVTDLPQVHLCEVMPGVGARRAVDAKGQRAASAAIAPHRVAQAVVDLVHSSYPAPVTWVDDAPPRVALVTPEPEPPTLGAIALRHQRTISTAAIAFGAVGLALGWWLSSRKKD